MCSCSFVLSCSPFTPSPLTLQQPTFDPAQGGTSPELELSEPPSLWENKIKAWMERYEEASSNQYSEDVQVLLRVKEQGDGKSLAYNTHPASFKPPVEVRTVSCSSPHGVMFITTWCHVHHHMVSCISPHGVIYITTWCHLYHHMSCVSPHGVMCITTWCHVHHHMSCVSPHGVIVICYAHIVMSYPYINNT